MNKMSLTALALVAGMAVSSAHAATVFSQNFEAGLGANESVSGAFSINSVGFGSNGTNMMGHAGGYGNTEYSAYTITGLTLGTGAELSFDYAAQFETHFDRFNVLVNGTLATTTAGSNMKFINLDHEHYPALGVFAYDSSVSAGGSAGTAVIDLSAYAGQSVNITFQFGSDGSITAPGINIDNVSITSTSAVPEPESLALVCAGIAVVAASRLRGRRPSTAI